MENYLTEDRQREMRSQGVITANEVAIQVGDLLIAENVLTKERRVLQSAQGDGRRVLKG